MSEPAADREADRHARKGRQARRSPRERIREGSRDMAVRALAEAVEKGMPGRTDGAQGADGKVDHPEVSRERHSLGALKAVLVAA